MTSSTLRRHSGIVVDANVLSRLAKAGRLDLIHRFAVLPLYITPTIYRELEIGVERGVTYLVNVLQLIGSNDLQVVSPEIQESQLAKTLPAVLAAGEAEAIAICQQRGMVFVTHDRKAANYCDRAGIACIRLNAFLAELQKAGLLTVSEAQAILPQ